MADVQDSKECISCVKEDVHDKIDYDGNYDRHLILSKFMEVAHTTLFLSESAMFYTFIRSHPVIWIHSAYVVPFEFLDVACEVMFKF